MGTLGRKTRQDGTEGMRRAGIPEFRQEQGSDDEKKPPRAHRCCLPVPASSPAFSYGTERKTQMVVREWVTLGTHRAQWHSWQCPAHPGSLCALSCFASCSCKEIKSPHRPLATGSNEGELLLH